jgi:hypothetical protein
MQQVLNDQRADVRCLITTLQEAVQGPPKEIWSQHDQNTDRTAKGKRKGGRAHVEDDQTGEGSAFSPVKLREYELSKLR